jgi:hypothetical protein
MENAKALTLDSVIVTQTTQHLEAYKERKYAAYSVTSHAGDMAILNDGAYALIPSRDQQGAYAIQKLITNYRKNFYVTSPCLREVDTWQVALVKTFAGDTAKSEADSYVKLLNEARELLKGVKGMAGSQREPHTITSDVQANVLVATRNHMHDGMKSLLETLTLIREKMEELAVADSKMHTKYNAINSGSSGKFHMLTNADGLATGYCFMEGTIITVETRNATKKLQVTVGNSSTIYLADSEGNAAGTITLRREHLAHVDDMAINDLGSYYRKRDVCTGCSDPVWQVDMLMLTDSQGDTECIEKYTASEALSFEQEAAYAKWQAWQEAELRNIDEIAHKPISECANSYGFDTAYEVLEVIFNSLHGRNGVECIQYCNNALQDTLDKAVLDAERVVKEREEEVQRVISGLATINGKHSIAN